MKIYLDNTIIDRLVDIARGVKAPDKQELKVYLLPPKTGVAINGQASQIAEVVIDCVSKERQLHLLRLST